MATIATVPTYAPPKREVQIVVTLTESGTNFARLWVTAAPEGSALRGELDKAAQSVTTEPRVEFKTTEGGSEHPIRHSFDKGGAYSFAVQEYARGGGFSGGYEGSPDTSPSETKVGSESALTVYIGQRMTTTLGAATDTATLVLWVWNDTIRPTTIGVHAEATPAIVAPTSERARNAAGDAAVQNLLFFDIAGVAVTTALGNPLTVFKEIVTEFNDHAVTTTSSMHANANTLAVVPPMYETATSVDPAGVNALLLGIRRHITNDLNNQSTGVTGPGSGAIHEPSGTKIIDSVNLPQISGVNEQTLLAGLGEAWRCYNSHRLTSTPVHGAADSTNALTNLPVLIDIHRLFFVALANSAPTTPPGQTSGATVLRQRAAYKEAPL